MKLIVKKLQGGECTVEVLPTTTIREIKVRVYDKLKIPCKLQKLLFLGRNLVDDKTVQSYPNLKDGSKLNLIVKKVEKPLSSLYRAACKTFKETGLTDAEASAKAKLFVKNVEEKFNRYSWDDIEKLSADCMREENMPRAEREARALAAQRRRQMHF